MAEIPGRDLRRRILIAPQCTERDLLLPPRGRPSTRSSRIGESSAIVSNAVERVQIPILARGRPWWRSDNSNLLVRVHDTGTGILKTSERIFEPFVHLVSLVRSSVVLGLVLSLIATVARMVGTSCYSTYGIGSFHSRAAVRSPQPGELSASERAFSFPERPHRR